VSFRQFCKVIKKESLNKYIPVMKRKTTSPGRDYCWVFIARDNDVPRQLHIGMATDLPQLLQDNAEREILYYRQFSTTIEGLGHKLFLVNVENETLWQTIRGMNPTGRDLKEEFNQL